MGFRPTVIVIVALATLLPVGGAGTQSNGTGLMTKSLTAGVWGGDHIRMDVDSHGAEIEFDCARGQILEPLMVDQNGRFRLKGSYRAETPAPMQAGDGSVANAIYLGRLQGDRLRLEVSIAGVEGTKSFELIYGQPGRLAKCA